MQTLKNIVPILYKASVKKPIFCRCFDYWL